jgi:proteic killer suppression protein
MIQSFADKGTEDIFEGTASKAARKVCPQDAWARARRKLDDINQVRHYSDLKTPPSNKLHQLKGRRAGQWAIAINKQYRICFRWEGTDAFDVEITDYH